MQDQKLNIDGQSTLKTPQARHSFDLGDLQYANAHGFFDINQNYPNTQPPLVPNFSTPQEQTFSGSPSLPQTNFPLADLSAMMFPNPEDPFAYPSQSTDLNYDMLMKNMNRAGTENFPFSMPMDGDRLQRNGFVPPSSTFMFTGGSGEQQTPTQDSDVQLLGPMPMYMMQGASSIDSPVTPSLQMSSGTGTTNGSPVRPPQLQSSRNEHNIKFYPTGPPNVNLDSLLDGEEWTGLPTDRSALNTFVSSNTVNVNDGMFRKRSAIGQQQHQRQQEQQQSLQFQDLAPGMLGWGLEGF